MDKAPRSKAVADALVFFGASGDLAYKKIFPALLAMVRQDGFDLPIIGVSHSQWTDEQLVARARDSVENDAKLQNRKVDEAAFRKLAKRLAYVNGDYDDAQTYAKLKKALGASKRPLHYLAIPPDLFRQGRRRSEESRLHGKCARRRGKTVWPRSEIGARTQPNPARRFSRGSDLPHRSLPRQGTGAESSVLPIREFVSRTGVESQLHRERADHDGGRFRRRRPRIVLRRRRRHPRRDPESSAAGRFVPGDGRADRHTTRPRCAPRSCACSARYGRSIRRMSCAGNTRDIARSKVWRANPMSKPSRRCACTSIRGAGRACRSTSAPASDCR